MQNGERKQQLMICLSLVRARRKRLEQHLAETRYEAIKAFKKWKHLVNLKPIQKKSHKLRKLVKRQRVGPLLNASFDIYSFTGILVDEFLKIFKLIEKDLEGPRSGKKPLTFSNSLVNKSRLALVLTYLRRGQDYDFTPEWQVSRSYVTREFRFMIPILASRCSFINIPKVWERHPFEDVVAAMDCSSHFRVRVHPHQHDYYRGDKKGFFLSAQVVCSLNGELYDVAIFPGRVNDQMAFNLTWQDILARENVKMLADGGYSDPQLLTPIRGSDQEWSNLQKSLTDLLLNMLIVMFTFLDMQTVK